MLAVTNPIANSAARTLESEGVLIETTGQERYQEFDAVEVLEVLNRSPDELPAPSELMASTGPQLELIDGDTGSLHHFRHNQTAWWRSAWFCIDQSVSIASSPIPLGEAFDVFGDHVDF